MVQQKQYGLEESFASEAECSHKIFCDNKSTIALSKNPSKHIDICFHKIRELVAEKEVMINYYHT